MTVQEFFLLYDTLRPHDPEIDYAGGLTENDCQELYGMIDDG